MFALNRTVWFVQTRNLSHLTVQWSGILGSALGIRLTVLRLTRIFQTNYVKILQFSTFTEHKRRCIIYMVLLFKRQELRPLALVFLQSFQIIFRRYRLYFKICSCLNAAVILCPNDISIRECLALYFGEDVLPVRASFIHHNIFHLQKQDKRRSFFARWCWQ
jgi:hypothetical protein